MFTFHPPGRQLPKLVFTPAKRRGGDKGSGRRGKRECVCEGTRDRDTLSRAESVHSACGFAESTLQLQNECEDAPQSAKPQAGWMLPASADASESLTETPTPPRKRRGRPEVICGERKAALLHILRRGQSRSLAAARTGIDVATIGRSARRDPVFGAELQEAEVEGQRFLAIYDKLLGGKYCVFEPEPVISTPELEREKAYLIACGVPAHRVLRLRVREWEDERYVQPEEDRGQRTNRDIKVRPWKKVRRK